MSRQTAWLQDAIDRVLPPQDRPAAAPDAVSRAAPDATSRAAPDAASRAALDVVDLGGGTGGLAVAVAQRGHRVTVVDPSPNALATLEQRAGEAGVTSLVRGVLGDATTLPGLVGPRGADVVFCHGVLEVVDDPLQALCGAAEVLRDEGTLSVLAAQQSGTVFARVLGGHVEEAAAMLAADPDLPPRRFARSTLERLLAAAGFGVVDVRGVRVFTDVVDDRVVDASPGAAERLREMEAAVCRSADFLPFAPQLHLVARVRPAG